MWEKFVKRYVWDSNKTPYLIGVDKLTKPQAHNELFVYSLFLATLFAVVTLVSLRDIDTVGSFRSYAVAAYTASIFCCGIFFGASKHFYTALYCVTAPAACFLNFTTGEFRDSAIGIEQFGFVVFSLLWLRYAVRVVAIAKAYHQLPEKAAGT